MKKPCDECIVNACCTERCYDYAEYIYHIREYYQAGTYVKNRINNMSKTEAIEEILKIENIYLYMKRMDI